MRINTEPPCRTITLNVKLVMLKTVMDPATPDVIFMPFEVHVI